MNKKIFSVILVLFLSGCTSLLSDLTSSLYEQKDIQLVKDGAPSFLLVIEGLLKNDPNNKDMLIAGIQMFSAYSGAFVDSPERKALFNEKTMNWTRQLLATYPGYRRYLSLSNADKEVRDAAYDRFVSEIQVYDVQYLFWAAYSWSLYILANIDKPDVFIELPYAKAILRRIYQLDSTYYNGAPHLIEGVFYGAYPPSFGGNLEKAKEEFEAALRISNGTLLMIKMFYADFYYKPKLDRAGYERLLNEIIATDVDLYPENRLMNILTQQEARKKLDTVNEIFADEFEFDF